MRPYKGRKLDPSRPIRVYRNLRVGGYSVQQDAKVVAHAESLAMRQARFLVNEAGYLRVRATGRKTVHAYVEGYLSEGWRNRGHDVPKRVTYNPRTSTGPYFTLAHSGRRVDDVDWVFLGPGGVFVR